MSDSYAWLDRHLEALFPISGAEQEKVEYLGHRFSEEGDDAPELIVGFRLTRRDGSVDEASLGFTLPEYESPGVVRWDGIRYAIPMAAMKTWLLRLMTAVAARAKLRFARWEPENRATVEQLLRGYRGL